MQDLKLYILNVFALLTFQVGFSQENEQHIIKSPTKELKMVLYSNGKPVVEGYVIAVGDKLINHGMFCLLYTSPSPRDRTRSRMPSSA